mgnify:CR=1 FL=1
MTDDISEKKKELGLKYTISYAISVVISYWFSYSNLFNSNENFRKIALPLLNLLPLLIDKIIKKIIQQYLYNERNKKQSKSENDLKEILADPNLSQDMKVDFQNKLSEMYKMKIEMNKNDLLKVNNQITDLEK